MKHSICVWLLDDQCIASFSCPSAHRFVATAGIVHNLTAALCEQRVAVGQINSLMTTSSIRLFAFLLAGTPRRASRLFAVARPELRLKLIPLDPDCADRASPAHLGTRYLPHRSQAVIVHVIKEFVNVWKYCSCSAIF